MTTLRRAAPLLLLLGAAPAVAADLGEYLFTRPLDVPAAGPVMAPLDRDALRHLLDRKPAVFDADDREVPSRLQHDCCRVGASLVEARREGESWRLLFDLGAEPPLHEQLHFRLRRITAATVLLEGSDDRASWRPLAEANLFRLGSDGELARSALVYSANRHRWLRLTWPAAAGTPELREVEIVGGGGPALTVAAAPPACRREGAALACDVPFPAPWMIGLRFHLRWAEGGPGGAGGRLGYRLLHAGSFEAWETLAEGTAPLAAGALAVPLPPQGLPGESLRLELYGDPAPPRPAGWRLELARRVVLFHAPRAGRYTLAYGGGEPLEGQPDIDAAGAVRVAPGPERRSPLPPLPAAATAPAAPLDADDFAISWPVRAPRARAGDVVRLDLPPAVLAATWRRDDVRLAVGGRQLPFLLVEPRANALALSRPGLRPRPERGGRRSRVTFAVDPGQDYTALSLTAPAPFTRTVTVSRRHAPLRVVRYLQPIRFPEPESEVDRRVWECSTPPPLPCRWEPEGWVLWPTDRVTVRFDDADNPPLAWIDAALWRPRHLLVFVWPAAGEVRLLAGARGDPAPAAPRYDLELLEPQLLARPWRAAAVDVGGGTRMEERGPAWLPLLIPAVLALAAVMLLVVLARVIGKRP